MNKNTKTYRSNGKLLISAEYVVLDGAKALALPTNYGQSLTVETNNKNTITWKSYNEFDNIWFEDIFVITYKANTLHIQSALNTTVSKRLIEIFEAIKSLNPSFLNAQTGYAIKTHQDFNRLWGLGTSSTLIANLAQWAHVDAYALLARTFGGSGYDIACAMAEKSITYQLQNTATPGLNKNNNRTITAINFNPSFSNHLYFVYLNQKQNSRDGIGQYKSNTSNITSEIKKINDITDAMIACGNLLEFQKLIDKHENIISKIIKQNPIKKELFNDFNGSIKSLGAWGGDFVLVATTANPEPYFRSKGYHTIINYKNMIKN